jgi:hypothetical protein
MKETIKNFLWFMLMLWVVFLILDVTNLTGFFLYPRTRMRNGPNAAGDTTN